MKILVTNDDGIHAPGIQELAEALARVAQVAVVAPDRERSAVSHALTLHHPLRAFSVGHDRYAVDGTPTDCVNLGIHNLISFRPDLVVSGINRGGNMGDDLTYSGTVSAAMEATLMGIPALAFSLVTTGAGNHYADAAEAAVRLVMMVAERGLPDDTFLNINIPDLPLAELGPDRITVQGKRDYEGSVVVKTDPRGNRYFWIGTSEPSFLDLAGTDFHAVKRGSVSITPLHLDLTNHAAVALLSSWVPAP
jgi:5'-nucleotidase